MRRRRFLLATSAAFAAGCDHETEPRADELGSTPERDHAAGPFLHGVASGDPRQDRVILWTRVEAGPEDTPRVDWEIGEDATLERVVARGSLRTSAARDHTVKVDAKGLSPGRTYYYRFATDGAVSPIGRTRTLPGGSPERVRLAVVSCSNYAYGFFNAYAAIAARDDLDAVVHVGDYIYEYANGEYGDGTELGRIPDPPHECTTLADYRRRHAIYKRDPDLQGAHRQHPFITVWDDHEVANDAWMGGAKNHQSSEGDWETRKAAAVEAYREWMPIRDPLPSADPLPIWRRFTFGDLVDLLMLDTRLVGRDEMVAANDDEALADPTRSLLGDAQERWLLDALGSSTDAGVVWRVLGQQCRMGQLRNGDGTLASGHPWDGYPLVRDRVLAELERLDVGGNLVLTGDVHSGRAIEVHRDPYCDPPTGALAIELIAPAVCSPISGASRKEELLAANPHVRWMDLEHWGYLALELTAAETVATWHLTKVREVPDDRLPALQRFRIPRDEARLEPA